MIYTFTLNPAIDYHMAFESIELGELNRAHLNRFTVGGKGINVAIILKRLNADVIATGFMGGFTGEYLKHYLQAHHQLPMNFVPIKDNTRINVKLSNHQVTELNARAPYVNKEEYAQFQHVFTQLNNNDWVVLAGSGLASHPEAYLDVARHCQKENIPFIADVEREALETLLPYKPFLIKPNLFELESYFKRSLKTKEAVIAAGIHLLEAGAQHVLVSLGAEGSMLISHQGIYRAKPLKVTVRNVVGSGDSMVGAFLATYIQTKDILKSYRMAAAAGTATAMSHELATQEDIETIAQKIEIEEVTQ